MISFRNALFFGLTGVRFMSVVAMLLVFASSIFVLVTDIEAVNRFMKDASDADMTDCDYIENSTVPNQPAGVFWAVVNRLLIIFQIIMLILSECSLGWVARFFDRYFPVLGSNFGLGPLGIFQCLIGATILSHHVDDFTLVAAFWLFAVGCLNMFLGLVFREKVKDRRSIKKWWNEKKGVLPTTHDLRPQFERPQTGYISSLFTGSSDEKTRVASPEMNSNAGMGFGRQGEKSAKLKGFLISRPLETLPRYAPPPRPVSTASSVSSRSASPDPHDQPRFKSSETAI